LLRGLTRLVVLLLRGHTGREFFRRGVPLPPAVPAAIRSGGVTSMRGTGSALHAQ